MPAFRYRAISRDGAHVTGVVEAYDQFDAVEKIRESCSIVTSVTETASIGLLQREVFPQQISQKSLALLSSQFSIILAAGLPVVRAVELIAGQTRDRLLKRVLRQVAEDTAAGFSLAQSFENKAGKYLPVTFIETVRAGEDSGTLEVAFKKLQTYYDKAYKVKSKVRSAMMYPVFLCILAVVVIGIIMAFVMPVFTEMFASLDVEMPALTRGLMVLSAFVAGWWPLLLALAAALIIAFKLYARTDDGRLRLARLQLKLPALGRVARMKGASQLANTMATMLAAGLPVIRTVAVTARTLDNFHLSLQLGSSVTELETGRPLGDCLRECHCFPDMLVEMAGMGEATGSLELTLETAAAYYDSEVNVATERALSMIQPAITIVMGIIIGLIVIALYLPMFTMYSGM